MKIVSERFSRFSVPRVCECVSVCVCVCVCNGQTGFIVHRVSIAGRESRPAGLLAVIGPQMLNHNLAATHPGVSVCECAGVCRPSRMRLASDDARIIQP